MSFASHCDIQPYHGWILGYDETTLAQVVVFNLTPNGSEGGIWQSGCGPGVDTNGDLIAITGNGTFETSLPRVDYGDSFLRLTPGAGTLSVTDFFTPSNELTLDVDDLDLGSGGNLLLPDQLGTTTTHLMVSAGKQGTLYVVNRDNMGGFNSGFDQIVQEIPNAIGSLFGTPAYWQGTVPKAGLENLIYTIGSGDHPKMFVIDEGKIQTPPAKVANNFSFGYPGASPVISANGTTGGIMWAIDSSQWKSSGPAILYAFDATNLTNELYDSNQFSADAPGPAVKFTVPTVANGSVYMGTQTQLAVFGLFPGGRPSPTDTPTPTGTPSPSPSTTATPTLSPTPTVTMSATPSPTPTPTVTPMPTASPSPVFAALSGPKTISFPNEFVGHQSKSKSITVVNEAAAVAVTLSPTTTTGGFVVTSNNCPVQLQPESSCVIGVAFMPSMKGKQHGQLQVNSNAMFGLRTIVLKGKGLAPKIKSHPKTLSFGQVSIDGVSSAQSITIVNRSPVPITFTTAPAATPPFNVTANTCNTIAANGGTCTVSVEFAPHSRGKFEGRLELQDNVADLQQHIKLFGSSK